MLLFALLNAAAVGAALAGNVEASEDPWAVPLVAASIFATAVLGRARRGRA